MVGIFKFMFPKKLSINLDKNSTKVIKGKEKTFWWDIKKQKNTIPKHILKKKKPSTLIRVIRKNKNSPKERRERESTHSHGFQNRTGPGGRTVKIENQDENRFFKPKEPDFLLINIPLESLFFPLYIFGWILVWVNT